MKSLFVFSLTEADDTPDYTPGIKQSGNAKISFSDKDYFASVSFTLQLLLNLVMQAKISSASDCSGTSA